MRPAPSKCRSCEAEILWVETKAGKRMPLDREPQKRVVLLVGDRIVAAAGDALAPDSEEARAFVVDTFMPHHATCPQGTAWQRGRGERKKP